MASKVYFSKEISPDVVLKLYRCLGKDIKGKIAFKVHSGEDGNQNFLHPEFWRPIIDELKGTVVECNTAYGGARNSTEKHKKLIEKHGWNEFFDFDLMDENDDDIVLDIPNGKQIKKDYVGGHLSRYDGAIVLSHFKGHPMGGFGGALKQLSIGFGSSRGKAYIHSAGHTLKQEECWDDGVIAEQDAFLESMADAASAVHKHFNGNIAYINVMKNLSVDCDCCAVAEDPCMKDIGILASLDPIAIDQACVDLIYTQIRDPGRNHFIERIESRHGIHTIEAAAELGFGSREYELIEIK